jgi:hypothetical protein
MRYEKERGSFRQRSRCTTVLVRRRRGELIRDVGVKSQLDIRVAGVQYGRAFHSE